MQIVRIFVRILSSNKKYKDMNRFFRLLSLAAAVIFFVSCAGTKDIVYFQDSPEGTKLQLPEPKIVEVQISDKISIIVNSKDPELASIFNLTFVNRHASRSLNNELTSNSNNNMSVYTVDTKGNIDFPVLGELHVQGLTREEIAAMVKNMIISRKLIMDPVVTVEFANLFVTVLGDVSHPGRHEIDKDKVTVLDVISKAGDLDITGLRKNVKVFREEDGKQICYQLDFTSAENVFTSPVYYLKQDDIIYVEPNKMKVRESTVNGNTFVSASFWISFTSFLMSLTSFCFATLNLKK